MEESGKAHLLHYSRSTSQEQSQFISFGCLNYTVWIAGSLTWLIILYFPRCYRLTVLSLPQPWNLSFLPGALVGLSQSWEAICLLCSGCYNKMSWIGWLQQQKSISSSIVFGSQRSRTVRQLSSCCVLMRPFLGTWFAVSLSFLIRALNRTHHKGPTVLTSSKHNYLPNTPPPKTVSLGVRAPTYELKEGAIQSITTLANE